MDERRDSFFYWIQRSLRNKLVLTFLGLTLIPLLLFGGLAFQQSSDALSNDAVAALEAIRTLKAKQVEDFFAELERDARFIQQLDVITGGDSSHEGMAGLVRYKDMPHDPVFEITYEQIAGFLNIYGTTRGIYQNIMLVDDSGDVVFATFEEAFGSNVIESGDVEEAFLTASRSGIVKSDLEHSTTRNETNLKLGAPVQDAEGNLIGSLILEVGAETINEIMGERTGQGVSGETFLVGRDNFFRSEPRFANAFEADQVVGMDVEALTVSQLETSGIQLILDYRGVNTLISWSPLVIEPPSAENPNGVLWYLIAKIDQVEVQRPVVNMALLFTGLGLIIVLIAFLVALWAARLLTRQFDAIRTVFTAVMAGDLSSRVPVMSQDEVGEVATGLNTLIDRLAHLLVTSQQENQTLQASVQQLLVEVTIAAAGDLTAEANVTTDATGAIADSFNYLVEQWRAIISQVRDASLQVSSAANEIQTTAEHLAIGSQQQAAQIVDTSAAIDEMSVSIQQVSENTALSATIGEEARFNAEKGTQAVQNTIEGMHRIRNQVTDTEIRIERLQAQTRRINEMLEQIDDIAGRTTVLALNASIQAAVAGEAGKGFAVVAQEVERLAQSSAETNHQIAQLVHAIQNETSQVVSAMKRTTEEVLNGTQLAHEAGTALQEIRTVSIKLSEIIQSTSHASQQQARGSEAIARAMNDISQVTQQTAAGTKQATHSITNLAELSDQLRTSVSIFKLSPNGVAH